MSALAIILAPLARPLGRGDWRGVVLAVRMGGAESGHDVARGADLGDVQPHRRVTKFLSTTSLSTMSSVELFRLCPVSA